jgi:hypothetical protein
MESELLSGNPIRVRDQRLSIDPGGLDPELRKRVSEIVDLALSFTIRNEKLLCVLDSGIDPRLSFGEDEKNLKRLDADVVAQVGRLPELPEPTDNVLAVVEAWEDWLKGYKEEALRLLDRLNAEPPAVVKNINPFVTNSEWGAVKLVFGEGLEAQIPLDTGSLPVRNALAGNLWDWAASMRFSDESYAAGEEATASDSSEGQSWLTVLPTEKLAELYLEKKKNLYQAAKAHHLATQSKVPDFDTEMQRWAEEHGSERLRLGIQDGYRMNARYLAERLAAEAPGMYAVSPSSLEDDWAHRAGSPSEESLRLRRKIAAAMKRNAPSNLNGPPESEIVVVKKPPHGIYLADEGVETAEGIIGRGLPKREGWPWRLKFGEPIGNSPTPFEAVVVKNWLAKYHLIGAVADSSGSGPPGIWAVPEPEHFAEDGHVTAQDPDAPEPNTAKRKPPDKSKEDDIPF